MGRPLSQKILEKMNITVDVNNQSKKLVKQVGYNKYVADDESIVTLGKDAKLTVKSDDNTFEIIKIMRNILQADGKIFSYDIDVVGKTDDGKDIFGVVFTDENVSFKTSINVEGESGSGSIDEPVIDSDDENETTEDRPTASTEDFVGEEE